MMVSTFTLSSVLAVLFLVWPIPFVAALLATDRSHRPLRIPVLSWLGLAGPVVASGIIAFMLGAGYAVPHRIDLYTGSQMGFSIVLGFDGWTLPALVLTGITALAAILSAHPRTHVRAFHACLLATVWASALVFLSRDALLFFVGYEGVVAPMVALLLGWGGPRAPAAARRLALFALGGSVPLAAGLLLLAMSLPEEGVRVRLAPGEVVERATVDQGKVQVTGLQVDVRAAPGGDWTALSATDLRGLQHRELSVVVPRSTDLDHWRLAWSHFEAVRAGPWSVASLAFVLLTAAFLVKLPALGLHTWLPQAHVEAPTSASVLLAGLLLKLGLFGLWQVAWPTCPLMVESAAPWLAALGLLGLHAAGWAALAQDDLKRQVAYLSVSHMGATLVAMAAGGAVAFQGAGLMLLAHGLASAALFVLTGWLGEQAGHRRRDGFGGLAARAPGFCAALLLVSLATAGVPGMAGFSAEFRMVVGTALSDHSQGIAWALLLALGAVVPAIVLLDLVRRVAFGPPGSGTSLVRSDIGARERMAMGVLMGATLLLGLVPSRALPVLETSAASLARHLDWAKTAPVSEIAP